MSETSNWRTDVDAGDYFLHQKKKNEVADRRPVIRRAVDLVGPGIADVAIRVTDWNNVLATYNGYFSSVRAANGPVLAGPGPNAGFDVNPYVGTVTSDAEIGGVQTITDLVTTTRYQRVFRRNLTDPSMLYWGPWKAIAFA